ncbi:class I SAM-dependent methyltransferase [Fischerella sp. PCC 9605]|uniref:class I SAM-dependent methyltransferase n=1 Tax=Fischerella sp. PCC 9605 TaxID=1173024 RepID=UPI0004B96209|nr:class I SAM-dependent methyltransferase [Fischerella sp. PCC 9605]
MSESNLNESVSIDRVVERYGEWTAMSIYLGNDKYTLMPPQVDYRLRRLVQITSDLVGKSLDQLRVLDLACLEGHYGIEFAQHGAEVVGIEIREANLEKARFVKHHLNLNNLHFHQDDVRNLSKEKYGSFDVVICSGILYHLQPPDVFEFVKNIYKVCDRLVLFDTFISIRDDKSVEFEGKTYWGLDYCEHAEGATEEDKKRDLWASINNVSSFWMTEPSLCNLIASVGFTSFYECHIPVMPNNYYSDRKTYVAIKGQPVRVLSSPITDQSPQAEIPEHEPKKVHSAQIKRSPIFRFVKRTFPQPVKNIIKPVLRAVRFLEPDNTPKFLNKQANPSK